MSFQGNIVQIALENRFFRKEIFTTPLSQLVVMSVEPGEDIGLETHHLDQVLVFVAGRADSYLDGHRGSVGPGDVVVVPAGTQHNFVNSGDEPLKLYTVYAPPEHAPGTIHRTKEEAEAAEHAQTAPGPAPALQASSPPRPVAAPAQRPGLTVGSLLGRGQ
jgi:mannose-6-phosphate isomerase-like protein (cupin superfamily)